MYTLIRLYLLTGDICDKLRQWHSTIRIWDSDARIGIISSATVSKRTVCNLPFENKLFGYIHYCTEISEININLLPNTCNFHRKFQFIFFRFISLRMPKMCTLEKLNFPPSILAPSTLDIIFAGLTLKCFRRACYFQSVIVSIILCILRTQKNVSFLNRKGCTFHIIQRYLF